MTAGVAMTAPARPLTGLYGLTPEWDDTARLLDAVSAAHAGGLQALQLRRKLASATLRRQQAEALRAHCAALGVLFIINDDVTLALAVQADGVHLGRDDGDAASIAAARAAGLQVGVSCYDDLARVRMALAAGATNVALGACYPSPTKPEAVAVPLARLGDAQALCAAAGTGATVVAIGGITPARAVEVRAAGADAIAVVSALFEADDITATAAAFTQALAGV